MATMAYQKLVFSGNFLEVYDYENGLLSGFKRKERDDVFEGKKQSLKRKAFSLTRTRRQLRRIVNSNPNLKKFLTLTFAQNITDLDVAHYEFKKFLYRLKTHKKDMKYIAVVEFQKRGAVHYHILCNLHFMKTKHIEKLWKNGFVKINRIDKCDNVGAYVCKYLQKDIMDTRLNGRKAFFTSRGIDRPIEVVDNFACKEISKMYNLSKRIPEKQFSYENEHIGKVKYSIYNLKNNA